MESLKEYSNSCSGYTKTFLSKMTRRKTVGADFFQTQMKRCLKIWDIVFLGTGHMIGAGIYILTGEVAKDTSGPALVVSFVLAGVAAFLSALCYAEFGGRVPKAGSAYSYGYVSIGEFWAFIIGWDMLVENMSGAAALGVAWSGYLDSLTHMAIRNGTRQVFGSLQETAGVFGTEPNFVAAALVILVSVFMAVGVKISTRFNSVFAVVNLLVIAFTVIYGMTFARKDYLTNPAYCQQNLTCSKHSEIVTDQCKSSNAFMPFGFSGVVSGAAKVFFAYVGFDSIAAAGEETVKPQRTIPLATLLAMIIVTLAYVMMSLTLTMMVPYCTIVTDSAFATAFKDRGVYWAQYVVSVGALSGMTTVLFGSLFATPRGVYAMSQDGLLCKFLSYVHPRTQTPLVGIVIFGMLTTLMSLVFTLKILTEFVSIGTLMAYSIVACSVIALRYEPNAARYSTESQMLAMKDIENKAGQLKSRFKFCDGVSKIFKLNYAISFMIVIIISLAATINFGSWYPLEWWSILVAVVLFLAFVFCLLFIFVHEQDPISTGFKMPLVPLLPAFSLLINVILMLRLSGHTWVRFTAWLVLGLIIYFGYGMWNSAEGKLAEQPEEHAKDDIEMTRASKYVAKDS